MWDEKRIAQVLERQRAYFRSGATLDVDWRIEQLAKLKRSILVHEEDLKRALADDLGRSEAEAYLFDIGSTVMEINETICGLKKWAKPETHFSGLVSFPSMITKVYKMPYGVSLIISPFNFPIILSLGVLAASIAGGNTAMIKASSKSPACTKALQEVLAPIFPEEYAAVVDGGHDVADLCLAQRFDKIFYTGSPRVGVHVLECAAKNLTPVALELGGENGNWCVVRADADLRDAARKIAFFKACNSGQVCININQVAVASEVADEFVRELKAAFTRQLGKDPAANPEYAHLISCGAWQKCDDTAKKYADRVVFGGKGDPHSLRYSPTILYPVDIDDDVVRHELFSPILPIVPFPDGEIDRVMDTIGQREHGLALYVFTRDMRWAERVMRTQQYGGGCINEVCLHLSVKGVPFNGTGHSGMGAYHGEWGFREFTHPSTVLIGSTHCNLPLREHPYNGVKNAYKLKLLKLFER